MIEGVRNSKNDPLIGQVVQMAHNDSTDDHLYCDGNTIGKDGSGATYEGEEYRVLFNKIKSLWTNAGTEDFDTGDTVKLPDLRGAFLRGDGTGSINGKSKAGPTVGVFQEDHFQGHHHNLKGMSNLTAPAGGFQVVIDSPNGDQSDMDNTLSRATSAIQGAHGIPRTTSETRPFNAGIKNYIRFM